MENEYKPKIIALVCNWCTYTAADLAGTSRLDWPAEIRLVRLMCTGMIDPKYIIKAFLDGADGVFVGGCHPGDCHYIDGNIKADKRIKGAAEILATFGFEPDRLRVRWIGASEGPEFQENMTEFAEKILDLGPSRANQVAVM